MVEEGMMSQSTLFTLYIYIYLGGGAMTYVTTLGCKEIKLTFIDHINHVVVDI